MAKNILIIEQDLLTGELYKSRLGSRFNVYLVSNAQEAIDIMDSNDIDLLITDFFIGKHNGVEILHEIRSYDDWISVPLLFLNSSTKLSVAHIKDWQRYNVVDIVNISDLNDNDLLKIVSKHSGYYDAE